MNASPESEQLINLFMNYETLGSIQPVDTGIFEFFKALPKFALDKKISFSTPSEVINKLKPADKISAPYPCSWAGEERDISAWTGNTLQKEALQKLYSIGERVMLCEDRRIKQDWIYLQVSDHFRFMSTKYFPGPSVYSPYENAYDAFSNYMNVLSDFITRVKAQFPTSIENEELNALLTTINNQEKEIAKLERELVKMKKKTKKAD